MISWRESEVPSKGKEERGEERGEEREKRRATWNYCIVEFLPELGRFLQSIRESEGALESLTSLECRAALV